MSLKAYESLVESYREVRAKVREMETERDFHSELSDLSNRIADVFRAKGSQILDEIIALETEIKNTKGGDG